MAAIELANVTKLSEIAAGNSNFKKKIWSRKVQIDARTRNEFKALIGGEGSGKPICEKQDAKKMNGETVTFTTTRKMKGRGRFGEQSLLDHTNKFGFGTFQVTVGMRRFAISWNQLLKLLRLGSDNMTPEQLEQELSTEWWASTEEDDIQHVLLRTALLLSGGKNVIRANNRASQDDLTLSDTLTTGVIELAQSKMLSQGGQALMLGKDTHTNGEIPQYVVFTPWETANPLNDDPKWREVVTRADSRGGRNAYFTGGMPLWNNMLIHRHNVVIDTGDGRLGSPLQPEAFLGVAIADNAATTITGGGAYNTAGTNTDVAINDYFANFPGYFWNTYEGEVAPVDNNTYYAIIYNPDGTYEGISYTAADIDGNTITDVTREVATILPTGHARYSAAHPSEARIIPCTKNGVPLGRALVMGSDALYLAKGAVDARRIRDGRDFMDDDGDFYNKAAGIMGIRGYTSPKDTIGRYPNFCLIEMAREIPGVDLVDMS